jgi:transglutaminase-like putative cysteine protease
LRRVPGHHGVGERLWLRAGGRVEIAYRATVEVERPALALAELPQIAPHRLPGDAVEYLFDSRYCPSERFHDFVEDEFGRRHGGERVAAIREWIGAHFTYEPGSSTATTTALDSFVERRGICRDYAHTLITLARASAIPARYAGVFAPGVDPPDFHAVAEVYLGDPANPGGGAWQPVDATGMAEASEMAVIGVGRDAADVSFLTTFGMSEFGAKEVRVVTRCREAVGA